MNDIPLRCIDSIMKCCDSCPWGWTKYPESVETSHDIYGCTYDCGCSLGYDQGRPEDEPTEEEFTKFDQWLKSVYGESVYK